MKFKCFFKNVLFQTQIDKKINWNFLSTICGHIFSRFIHTQWGKNSLFVFLLFVDSFLICSLGANSKHCILPIGMKLAVNGMTHSSADGADSDISIDRWVHLMRYRNYIYIFSFSTWIFIQFNKTKHILLGKLFYFYLFIFSWISNFVKRKKKL